MTNYSGLPRGASTVPIHNIAVLLLVYLNMFDSPFDDRFGFAFRAVPLADLGQIVSEILPPEAQKARSFPNHTRQATFAIGRATARLAALDLAHRYQTSKLDTPLLMQSDGTPDWPTGLVGSISHTVIGETVYCAAAVSDFAHARCIGIDIESRLRQLPPSLAGRVARESEQRWVAEQPKEESQRSLLLFSAKEAFFKAISPMAKAAIPFRDIELNWIDETSSFAARWSSQMGPVQTHIFMRLSSELVLAATYL